MKILAGVAAALAVAVLALGWQLKGAWADASLAEQRALQALQAAEEQRQQAEQVLGRLDSLDSVLTKLAEGDQQTARQLNRTLAAISGITQTEGDHDEAVACLDVPVPRQLDDSLR